MFSSVDCVYRLVVLSIELGWAPSSANPIDASSRAPVLKGRKSACRAAIATMNKVLIVTREAECTGGEGLSLFWRISGLSFPRGTSCGYKYGIVRSPQQQARRLGPSNCREAAALRLLPGIGICPRPTWYGSTSYIIGPSSRHSRPLCHITESVKATVSFSSQWGHQLTIAMHSCLSSPCVQVISRQL